MEMMMSANTLFTESVKIVATQEQVSSELADEVVILNLTSGKYYGLNTVGASIWNLIQQPKTIAEIRMALLEEYDVTPEECERDLQSLLQELAENKLIEIKS
jgi:hypothetical protein